jgi:uncharacterized membrane protein
VIFLSAQPALDSRVHIPEIFKLAGIAIVIIGLALRLRPTIVVVTAAILTGLISNLPLFSNESVFTSIPFLTKPGQEGIINMLGRAFADNRLMILFIATLPAIGLAERYGLQEQAARFIRKLKAATVGRLLIIYQLFRVLMGILGIRLSGHPAFVRPLVFPMSLGAAEALAHTRTVESLPSAEVERIKAANSAAENYGNFYGQNLSPVLPGILLVYGVMKGLGYSLGLWTIVLYAIPIASLSVILGALQFWLLDLRERRRLAVKR